MISNSAAISACEKGQQWEQALRLLREMRRSQMAPELISYNAAISAGGEQASELFMEMRRKMVEPDETSIAAALTAAEWNQHREPENYVLE